MTGILCMMVGINGSLDTEIITVGEFVDFKLGSYTGYGGLAGGSISDGQFAPKSGATIQILNRNNSAAQVTFQLSGIHTNDGFTNMRINNTDYPRASASFSSGNGITVWVWAAPTQPFTAVSTETVVVFT